MIKEHDIEKLEELKEKLEDSQSNNIDIDIKKEIDVLEERLFRGLSKAIIDRIYRVQDNIIKQIRHLQSKQNEIDRKITKLLKMAEDATRLDDEELKRKEEIRKHIEELKKLGVNVDVEEVE